MIYSISLKARIAILIVFVAMLLVFMPMRWIIEAATGTESQITASGASGTIWSGQIHELQFGQLNVGTIDAGLDPIGLFTGNLRFWFDRSGANGESPLSGSIATGIGGLDLANVNGSISLGAGVAGLGSARVEFDELAFTFSSGKCREASGAVKLVPESSIFVALGVQSGLLARVRCDRDGLYIPFASASAMERVNVRMSADGRFAATLGLEQPDAEIAPVLSLAGFRNIAGGYQKSIRGRFW